MLCQLVVQLNRLRREQAGVTLVEYGLLAFLIAVAATVFLAAIGLDLAEGFDYIENWLGVGDANSATSRTGIDDTPSAPGVN